MIKIKNIIIVALILFSGIFSSYAKDKNSDEWTANQRKAEYLFLHGYNKSQAQDQASFFELSKRAYEIDPTNTAVAWHYGTLLTFLAQNDSIKLVNALALMKPHVDQHPDDYYENFIYANINSDYGFSDEAFRIFDRLSKIYPSKIELRYKIADEYAKHGQLKRAIQEYDSLENYEGKDFLITSRKIYYYGALKDTVGALNEARRLLETAPQDLRYNLALGQTFLDFNYPDSALVYYDKAEAIEPDNGLVSLSKADMYRALGDTIAFDNQIEKALLSDEMDVSMKVETLQDYIKINGEDQRSHDISGLFNAIINKYPHEADLRRLYANYLASNNKVDSAAEQLSFALDMDPTNANDWIRMMFLKLYNKKYEEAIKASEKSLEYNPDNIALYKYIGPTYFMIKEYDKALEIYNKALSLVDSTDYKLRAEFYGGMADAYAAKKDSINAVNYYEKALNQDDGNLTLLNNYAFFLSNSGGDLQKAEKLIGFVIKEDPNNYVYLDTYAWVFFRKGEYKLAKIYIEKALNLYEDPSDEIYEHYGDILFMNGEPENALIQWERALELNPDSEILQRKVKFKTYFYK